MSLRWTGELDQQAPRKLENRVTKSNVSNIGQNGRWGVGSGVAHRETKKPS